LIPVWPLSHLPLALLRPIQLPPQERERSFAVHGLWTDKKLDVAAVANPKLDVIIDQLTRQTYLPQSGHPSYAKIYKSNRSNPKRNKNRIQRGHNSPSPVPPQSTQLTAHSPYRPFYARN
jgi:hypothetical protein